MMTTELVVMTAGMLVSCQGSIITSSGRSRGDEDVNVCGDSYGVRMTAVAMMVVIVVLLRMVNIFNVTGRYDGNNSDSGT